MNESRSRRRTRQPSPSPAVASPGRSPSPALGSPAGSSAAASVRGLVKVYGSGDTAVRALDGVDLDLPRGRFTAVMGPSGSGKSTLLHCLAGLDTPTSGRVWLGETELTSLADRALTLVRRERIGFVFQAFNLLPALTAEQNIVLPLQLAGRAVDRTRLADLVTTLGLTGRLHHRPAELSGGQQQRVAIARALLPQPDLVVADEPTGNLDSRTGAEVLAMLRRSSREFGHTVVMVTHDPVAAGYADQVVMVTDGRVSTVIDEPTPSDVLHALEAAEAVR